MGQLVSDVVEVGSLGLIDDPLGIEAAEGASRQASAAQLAAQREALDYLKEREALPQQFREEALTQLGGLYGLEGGEGSQQGILDRIQASPLFGQAQESAEEAILRSQGMTGKLRSGSTPAAIAESSNQLLLDAYNQQIQGLTGMAGMPSGAQEISRQMGGIGITEAQGIMAPAQMQQATNQALLGGLTSGAVAYFSDPDLKDDVIQIGETGGHKIYRWIWNGLAEKLGLSGTGFGVMADEVKRTMPDAIGEFCGYMTVDYNKLGIAHG